MENKTNPIQVADRIFAVIELLASHGPMGLLEISKELSLNKTTAHRILNSLIFMGYVIQDDKNGHYRLSYKLCQLSEQLLDKVDISRIVRPYLQELVQKTGETAHLVQMEGHEAVYIDKIESTSNTIRLVSQLGRHLPLYSSAVGKALLAERDEKTVRAIWKETDVVPRTSNTITNLSLMLKELKRIRVQGYSLDNEENEAGIRCIAASLGTPEAPLNYAFSISAPVFRMSDERIKELAVEILEIKNAIIKVIS